ncbi:hypoxanthine phosphoribosyltransferase [Culicoidibacter larvae]|uniref:Hypoxanthine phosphoribosyltransferase n=1 Tax=Culicoidibacter larvae TaxID=2579976 RepID=A0A5R8QEK9_9FIRM|nr:hypoxanthine phosphoribosyltransferase [Culicoidibacter larvae]TLG74227.1 hypoxanthine phosphoribosyltransferase [Culicoidibacter larvae]
MSDVKVLIDKVTLDERCQELAAAITADYQASERPLMVGILKGAIPFMSKVLEYVDIPKAEVDYMRFSSYEGTTSTNTVRLLLDLSTNIEDRDVIVFEDIIDTGQTLEKLLELLNTRKPKSLRVVSLLDKPERRLVQVDADYVGFVVPDVFIVGFGIDYNQQYRTLDYVGIYQGNEEV